MMPADLASDVIGNRDAPSLAGDVVNSLDVGCVAMTISIADDQVLFRQLISEIETAAQKMFSGDRIPKRCALFRNCSLDGGLDLLRLGMVHLLKVNRMFFQTSQDDGLNEFGIG